MDIGIGDIYEQHEKECRAMNLESSNRARYMMDSGACGCKEKLWYGCTSISENGSPNWELLLRRNY